MRARIENKHVVIGKAKFAKKGYAPEKILEVDGTVLVLFRRSRESAPSDNRNVFAFDGEGNLLWQIENVEHGGGACPFVDLSTENEVVVGHNWNGYVYAIDLATGKVSPRRFAK